MTEVFITPWLFVLSGVVDGLCAVSVVSLSGYRDGYGQAPGVDTGMDTDNRHPT
jgi:hypothetical protein